MRVDDTKISRDDLLSGEVFILYAVMHPASPSFDFPERTISRRDRHFHFRTATKPRFALYDP
jgi:hypothetical protein